ncbi:IclR family transcriptional regulator C-terminal domain-containing protein [Xanthobacteraceae bacterium Astr-EGSB]|uniref:IclR family transcriptional regulator domain-containing protein n=1 Tax=Astrobacterium formosum TaxID=3069710 RepID=UPI0027B4F791|nr:IclR family transcriptional regulator C-terminal domain-containing protein [Xanthobacteraceae bacterium Astr-EGSB]
MDLHERDDDDTPTVRGGFGEGAVPGDPSIMMSLVRGLAVIQAFSRRNSAMTISQISHKTGIPRAAVRRCLYTLRALGFADTDDGRRYALRPKILSLGHAYLSSIPFAAAAEPLLRAISDDLKESSSIAVLDGDDIVYTARASVSRIMAIDLQVGSRLPAAFTSMGRVLIAFRNEDLGERLGRVAFTPLTPRTIRDAAALAAEIARVRQQGYSVVDEELEIGLRSIAVPIMAADGTACAAINVGVHASRMSRDELVQRTLPRLKVAAEELAYCVR